MSAASFESPLRLKLVTVFAPMLLLAGWLSPASAAEVSGLHLSGVTALASTYGSDGDTEFGSYLIANRRAVVFYSFYTQSGPEGGYGETSGEAVPTTFRVKGKVVHVVATIPTRDDSGNTYNLAVDVEFTAKGVKARGHYRCRGDFCWPDFRGVGSERRAKSNFGVDGYYDYSLNRIFRGEVTFPYVPQAATPDARPAIVYSADGAIYVMDRWGAHRRELYSGGDDVSSSDPEWSPDGSKIAFLAFHEEGHDSSTSLVVMKSGGSDVENIADVDISSSAPTWSPDGSRIAYGDNGDIWTINADGTGRRNVTRGKDCCASAPDWSPDGQWIAYLHYGPTDDDPQQIWVMRPDGSDRHLLHSAGRQEIATDPAWSPDGTRIAFSQDLTPDEFGQGSVVVMRSDGSRAHQLARGENPTWIGHGHRIVFTRWSYDRNHNTVRTLCRVNLAGEAFHQYPLTRGGYDTDADGITYVHPTS